MVLQRLPDEVVTASAETMTSAAGGVTVLPYWRTRSRRLPRTT
jgi:hypothetical protein